MKPFMKPLYQEFEGHLYRLFNSTITEARNTYYEATGKDLDQEYERLYKKYGPRRVRAEMNWHILSVAVILEERETGKTMTEDEMGALFWTLGLQFDELEPHEMEEG